MPESEHAPSLNKVVQLPLKGMEEAIYERIRIHSEQKVKNGYRREALPETLELFKQNG